MPPGTALRLCGLLKLARLTLACCSLWLVVLSSVTVGTFLPFGLAKLGIDPANAGTSIQVQPVLHPLGRISHSAEAQCASVQVVMDILGCIITCVSCDILLRQLAGSLA